MDKQHVMVRSIEVRRAGGTLGLVFEIPWEEIDKMSRDQPVTALAVFEEPEDIANVGGAVAKGGHDALVHHEQQQQQNEPEEEAQDGQPE